MTIETDAITAIVLCGGRGSRMGGRDKPLLDYRGRPMVAHIVESLRGSASEVLISANRNLEIYGRYGIVVADKLVDHGPLSGIAACLQRCESQYAFVCPGDAPNLDATLIQRLARGLLGSSDAVVAVAHDGQQRQNLHLLLRTSIQSNIDAYLARGARSVKGWLGNLALVDVDCADIADSFADLDDPADF